MKKTIVSIVSLCLIYCSNVKSFQPSRPRREFVSTSLNVLSSESLATKTNVKRSRSSKQTCNGPMQRKGVDSDHQEEYWEQNYWFDDRIHVFGNKGFSGAFHAAVAAFSTKLIDMIAYDGVNIRHKLAKDLKIHFHCDKIRVVDLCCGVGISTRAIRDAFPNAATIVGVDTSSEMVAMAEFLTDHKRHLTEDIPRILNFDFLKVSTAITLLKEQRNLFKFRAKRAIEYVQKNAENTALPSASFNLVTIMYAFHEVPMLGREKILKEARRLLQPGGTLAVVDITSDYNPSDAMLMGEPYVLEYQKNIHRQLQDFKGFSFTEYKDVLPGHVGMWILKRKPSKNEPIFVAS